MNDKIIKPSILPGFMELLPEDQISFNKMVDIIRKNYEDNGFLPIDTPIIEKSEVLLAKGGGETEKQIYRFEKGDHDLSLRFDLTVPLARYVALHMENLNFPFRRYQIGKVFRGERNQKGRFREFYQCDIDIIGSNKLNIINDAEIVNVIYSTFKDLNFGSFTIHINNRKILNGFFDSLGSENKVNILRIIDKIDKIGFEAVGEELKNIGLTEDKINKIINFISISGTNEEILASLKNLNICNENFAQGLEELSQTVKYIKLFNVPCEAFIVDLKIARGLDYYTGTVYETILNDYPSIGSVCSGGRYDNLSEYYTKQKLPGVGISIGLTRLYYQLKEAGIIQSNELSFSKVLIIPMEKECEDYSINVLNYLRNAKVRCEINFEESKLQKKLNYANKVAIPYVIFIGQEEMKNNIITLKDMHSGEQMKLPLTKIIENIKFDYLK